MTSPTKRFDPMIYATIASSVNGTDGWTVNGTFRDFVIRLSQKDYEDYNDVDLPVNNQNVTTSSFARYFAVGVSSFTNLTNQ